MFHEIVSVIGIAELLSPEALITTAERIALDNPDDCELESWVVSGARVEGLVILVTMWRSDASHAAFKKFLGVVGLLALLYPRAYINYGASLAYTDTTTCEWKPWVYSGTRLVGFLYVLVALNELRKC